MFFMYYHLTYEYGRIISRKRLQETENSEKKRRIELWQRNQEQKEI